MNGIWRASHTTVGLCSALRFAKVSTGLIESSVQLNGIPPISRTRVSVVTLNSRMNCFIRQLFRKYSMKRTIQAVNVHQLTSASVAQAITRFLPGRPGPGHCGCLRRLRSPIMAAGFTFGVGASVNSTLRVWQRAPQRIGQLNRGTAPVKRKFIKPRSANSGSAKRSIPGGSGQIGRKRSR